MSDRFERILSVIASSELTPEEILIARESEPERRDRSLHPDRRLLKRLPSEDREILLLALGQGLSPAKIGRLRRVSKQAVAKRIQSAMKRLAWLRGPGRLFTGADLHRDLFFRILPEDRRMLVAFWRTKNLRELARARGCNRAMVERHVERLVEGELARLAAEDEDRYGRYLRGFRLLRRAITSGGSLFRGM